MQGIVLRKIVMLERGSSNSLVVEEDAKRLAQEVSMSKLACFCSLPYFSGGVNANEDVSPVPPTWAQPSAPSSPAHPPPLTPHQIALQQQHVLDSITKTPANELILQIKKLTFPSSCTFVLTLLERCVMAHTVPSVLILNTYCTSSSESIITVLHKLLQYLEILNRFTWGVLKTSPYQLSDMYTIERF